MALRPYSHERGPTYSHALPLWRGMWVVHVAHPTHIMCVACASGPSLAAMTVGEQTTSRATARDFAP
jgi:hypothetical protein